MHNDINQWPSEGTYLLSHLLTSDNFSTCHPALSNCLWTSLIWSDSILCFEHLLLFLAICRALAILEGDNEAIHCCCFVSIRRMLIPQIKERFYKNVCVFVKTFYLINWWCCLFHTRDTGARILSLIALGLDLDADFFHKIGALNCPSTFLRLLHYPGYIFPFPSISYESIKVYL